MAAYLIAEVQIRDPEGYEEYKQLVRTAIEQFGGRYLARGGRVEQLEGDGDPARLVVIEFGSFERARAFWESEAYREAKAIRHRTASSRLLLVEGM